MSFYSLLRLGLGALLLLLAVKGALPLATLAHGELIFALTVGALFTPTVVEWFK